LKNEDACVAVIHIRNKEVQIKIVYVGPGRGGKTTNLEYLFKKIRHRILSDMVSIKTHGDRTLFFDFLPFDLGQIHGYRIKTQLYTVPGQVKYNATRKLVLKGVDGIVFVADSMNVMREKNILALQNLEENLAFYGIDLYDHFPLVMQYNKRDLGADGIPLLDIETMDQDLNARLKAPRFEASALVGDNVIPTVKKAISTTIVSLQDQLA
jgi:mutual gliding-motility protein MglA